MKDELKTIVVDGFEEWREYDFGGRTYRISDPVEVSYRSNGSTHRVSDRAGIVHIVPAPGHIGCVVRFQGRIVA